MLYPLSAAGEERVDQRSVVGVSRPGGHWRKCTTVISLGVYSPGHRCARPPSLRLRRKEGSCNKILNYFPDSLLLATPNYNCGALDQESKLTNTPI